LKGKGAGTYLSSLKNKRESAGSSSTVGLGRKKKERGGGLPLLTDGRKTRPERRKG